MTQQTDLAERYGAPSSGRRALLVGVVVVVVAAFAGWVGWTFWAQVNPDVSSNLVGWDTRDEHAVVAHVEVSLSGDAVDPSCRLQAYAEDHTVVGELNFTPRDGTNDVTIRTERLATRVKLEGCTSADQTHAR
ncbi:MAG: DUF4307 domain-containing protein [Nocardioides sp.]|nr:DUF4307 domain-containing protein [Nocardioides sp.]